MGTIESVQAAVAEVPEDSRSLPLGNHRATTSSDLGPGEAQLMEVQKLLSRHGVSTSNYGREGCLTVKDLAREVAHGQCRLETDENGKLLRNVSLVEVTLVVRITGGRLALVEEEQVLDDGRRRQFMQRKLHGKLMRKETPVRGAWRCVRERLGLSATAANIFQAALTNAQSVGQQRNAETYFEVGTFLEDADTFEALSSSYPGLRTRYVVHRIEFQLPSLRKETGPGLPGLDSEPLCGWAPAPEVVSDEKLKLLLGELGLPSARSFFSVEGVLGPGNGGRVHLWRWVMHEAERIDEVNEPAAAMEAAAAAMARHDSRSSIESVRGDDELHHEYDDESISDAFREPMWSEEDAFGIEEAYRDLSGTLKLIQNQRVLLHERGGYMEGGHMEQRLNRAEGLVRKVRDKLGNMEELVRVNAKQLFGNDSTGEGKRMSRSLRRFISSNFTDGQRNLDDVSSMSPSPSAMSTLPGEDDKEISPEAKLDRRAIRLTLPVGGAPTSPESEPHSGNNSPDRSPSREVIFSESSMLVNTGASQHWILDTLGLHERTGRRSLLALAESLVVPKAEVLGTTDRTMRRFVTELHRKYEEHQNPFHNEAHAAVVCHSTHWLGMRSRAYTAMGENLHVATDIAALAHDVGHFGRNNAFCSSASHDLALIYNDRAILENMHSATCFQIMKTLGCDILATSTRENRRLYRDHIVSLILATDMATHFDFLGKFRVRVAGSEFNLQDNAEDRRIVTHCYLKAADLGHAALPFDMHERWAFRLLNEFYEQGDEERQLGIPVSPMCERSGNVADFRESQKGFLQFVIMPLFKELVTVSVPEVSETCLTRIECNAEEWIKGEANEELVQIIKAPAKPVKNTVALPLSPKRRLKGKKVGARVDEEVPNEFGAAGNSPPAER